MDFELSDEAETVLRAAGWFPGRRAAPPTLGPLLATRGFTTSDVALAFIDQFHGLRIERPHATWPAFVCFDAFEALAWIEPGDLRYLTALVQRPTCPIGHAGGSLLLVTPAGEVVLLSDTWLGWRLIASVGEALDECLGIRKATEIISRSISRDEMPPGFGT